MLMRVRAFLSGLLLAAVLSACSLPQDPRSEVLHAGETRALPQSCSQSCITPYGQVLGTAPGQVTAYSNCNPRCVVFEPNKPGGTFTGIKWQCVEFARRWLLDNMGVVYGDVDTASDIWSKIRFVTRVADGTHLPLQSFVNGSSVPPAAGDLLVYAKEYLGTGHVAVVTEVDLVNGRIKVAEQNFLNRPWPGNFARQIDVVRSGGYWVLDPYLLGWKRVTANR
jgi:CHAP domain